MKTFPKDLKSEYRRNYKLAQTIWQHDGNIDKATVDKIDRLIEKGMTDEEIIFECMSVSDQLEAMKVWQMDLWKHTAPYAPSRHKIYDEFGRDKGRKIYFQLMKEHQGTPTL